MAYALPGFVLAVPIILIYIYLPALYDTAFGMGLALKGGIFFAARLFDAVTDLIIRKINDRSLWSAGQSKPLIVLGAAVAAIGLIKAASPPRDVD